MLSYIKLSAQFTKDAKKLYTASQAFKLMKSKTIASITEDLQRLNTELSAVQVSLSDMSAKLKTQKPETVKAHEATEATILAQIITVRNTLQTFAVGFTFPVFNNMWDACTGTTGTANFKSVELLLNGFLQGMCFRPVAQETPEETPVQETEVPEMTASGIEIKTGRKIAEPTLEPQD